MVQKSLPRRAIKYAVISSSIIMLLVFYSMLTREVVGTPLEIVFRLVLTTVGAMWLICIIYLFTNPDAEKPRGKDF
jgi:uncharacterized membrane protein YgaE (UPF0421/DUF939 family)